MFDNIDDMEIDIGEDFYHNMLAESRRIQAVKDVAKKLQKLRRDFYEDDNKLETVRSSMR
jgi:hypothetical protein